MTRERGCGARRLLAWCIGASCIAGAFSSTAFAGDPINDDCLDRIDILILEGTVSFDLSGATTDGPDEDACNFPFGDGVIYQDVWYNYDPGSDGTVFLDTCGDVPVDTRIAVYEGCSCPTGVPIECNDDHGSASEGDTGLSCPGEFEASLSFEAIAGTCYKIRVGTFQATTPVDVDGLNIAFVQDDPFAACAPGAGDCFTPNGTPGCDDVVCCELICGVDPFCCDTEWDKICVDTANVSCVMPPTGGCCNTDGTCDDAIVDSDCTAAGGVYLGDDVLCADETCPSFGACCFGDICEVRTEADCDTLGGCYKGDDTACGPLVCIDCNENGEEDACETAPLYDPNAATPASTCAAAPKVDVGIPYYGNTTGAGTDEFVFCGPYYGFYDNYVRYCPRVDGLAQVTLQDTGPNQFMISVHDACPPTEDNLVACSFVPGQFVVFEVWPDREYVIRFAAFGQGAGPYKLTLNGPPAVLNPVDDNRDGVPDECECRADVLPNGFVGPGDYIAVLNSMGPCDDPPPAPCFGDINLDGEVDDKDLQILIQSWGPCPFGNLAVLSTTADGAAAKQQSPAAEVRTDERSMR